MHDNVMCIPKGFKSEVLRLELDTYSITETAEY